jgi:AcrR family transcriptional regulator
VEHGGECAGLRERKKIATRAAISHAAIRLALRHGPEHVRVPDIAAEAGVSPRTYNNYFSSVPEAICALRAERAMGIGDAVRCRPPGEPLAEAVANAMVALDPSTGADKEVVRMIVTTPALRGEFFKTVVARDEALAEAIAERVGAKPDDLFPQLLAAAYTSATRVVTQRWLKADDDTDYAALLREALDLVAPMAAAYQAVVRGTEAPRTEACQAEGGNTC